MAAHDLGKKVSVHRWKSGPGLLFVWAAMGAPWAYLVIFKIPIKDATDGALAFGMSALVFGLLGWLTWAHFKKKHDHVDVYEQGLVHVVAGTEKALRWDEIDKVTSKVEQRGVSTLHVHTVEGKGMRWTFTQVFEDIEALSNAIVDHVAQVLADRAMSRIRAGDEAEFGQLRIGPEGITRGDELLKWDAVEAIEPALNVVVIRKKGALLAWTRVELGAAHALAVATIRRMNPAEAARYR